MYEKFKNHIHTNFLALAGFPLVWYIKESFTCFYEIKSFYAFGFVTSFYFCPYMFLTLLTALILFIIGYAYKKIRKIAPEKKQNNLFYNIFFDTGFSLYLFFSIFFVLYLCLCIITDIFNIQY